MLTAGRGAALALVAVAACSFTRNARIAPRELATLDGFDAHRNAAGESDRKLLTTEADAAPFSVETPLYLVRSDGTEVGGRFLSIQVVRGDLDGILTDGRAVHVPLADVREARIETPDPDSMAQTITAYSIAAAAPSILVGLILLIVL